MNDPQSFDEILAAAATGPDETGTEQRPDLSDALAELARVDLRTMDLQQVLQRISELAQRTLPGVDEVSVSLIGAGSTGVTPAYTGEMALAADESQYAEHSGPCIEAAQGGTPLTITDTATEDRWPSYVPQARKAGVGSSLSVPLPVQETVTGALNLYSRTPHAFEEEAVEGARSFAGYAAVAVANAQLYETTAALARQMQDAMASRAVIEQAKGLIMGQRRCSPEEAFQLLVRASSRSNRKLRDVAADLIGSLQSGR